MSKAQPQHAARRVRRVNRRALIAIPAALVALAVAAAGLWAVQSRRNTSSLLGEAREQVEAKQYELALSYLNSYLRANPRSSEALQLKAKVLVDTARSPDDPALVTAINLYNQALAQEADSPEGREIRRRLVELNLQVRPARFRAAEALAREMVARDDDAQARRLLASTLVLIDTYQPTAESEKGLDEAVALFEKVSEEDPGDVATAERLADLYTRRGRDRDRALELLDRALEQHQGDPAGEAQAHLARARHFARAEDREAMEAELRQALEGEPGNLEARILLADLASQRGDTAAARDHLAKVASESLDDLRIKLITAQIELKEARHEEAIRSYRSGLVQVGGKNENINVALAQVLIDLNRLAEAEPLVEQYYRLVGRGRDDDGPPPLYVLLKAAIDRRKGLVADAIQALEPIRYKADNETAARVNFELGQAYQAARRPQDAASAYREAIRLNTRWLGPRVMLARLVAAGDPEAAVAELRRALDAMPNEPTLIAELGQVLLRRQLARPDAQRDWKELEALVAEGKRAAPNSAALAALEADLLNASRRPDDALSVLQGALRLNPTAAPLWVATAELQARLGRVDQALETLERATAAAGEQAGFRTARASLLVAQGKPVRARVVLAEGLDKVEPGQRPILWKGLAELYLARGDLANARKAYDEWSRLQPTAPEPRLAMVDLALAQGDRAAAEAAIEPLKGDGTSPFYRIGRAQVLLWDGRKAGEAPAEAADDPGRAARLEQAAALIAEIKREGAQAVVGELLEGKLLEARGEVDAAVRAYERALEDQAGAAALRPLVALLAREKRQDDLQKLRESPFLTPELRRLAADLTLRSGDTDQALRMIDQLVQGDPGSLDLRAWQARVLNTLGKGAEAEEAIRALIRQRPGEPAPYLQLLILQAGRGDREAAGRTVEEIRTRVRSDRPEILMGLAYRIVGDGARADESFRAALARWPEDRRVLLSAISYFESAGRVADAEAALRRLLKLDPDQTWAARKLAMILADRPRDAAAWKEALELVKPRDDGASTAEDRIALAVVLGKSPRSEDVRRGVEVLKKAVDDEPDNVAAQYHLARLLLLDRRRDEARAHAARAAEMEDAGGDPILLYAGMLLADKQFDKAEALLARLEKVAPGSLPTVELSARILAGRGEVDQAVAQLESAFDDHASAPEAFAIGQGIMKILFELKQPEAAERVGRKLADAVGSAGAALLAELEQARGRPDAALAAMETAVAGEDPMAAAKAALALAARQKDEPRWLELAERALDAVAGAKAQPGKVDLLQSRALLYHLQGRHPEELEAYEQILASEPKDFLFLNNMAWTLSENLGRPEDGLQRANEAIERIGYNPHLVDTRGVILTRLGRLDEAIADLEAAASNLPIAPVLYHLARAYHKAGREDDFRKTMDRAKEAGLDANQVSSGEVAEMQELMKR